MIRLGTEKIIPFIKNNLNDMPSSLMCYIYQFISLEDSANKICLSVALFIKVPELN
jgi:hypothetical protein